MLNNQNTGPGQLARRWRAIYPLAILLVCLPYAISFTSQLSSDDFILLYYYGTRPLSRIWTVFSPQTIWTYHPLQHSYFVLGWHLSGIEPWAYRAMSLGVHLATAFLLMKFARDLTDSMHFGGCTAIVFAGYWRHWEPIAWAASIATLESVFFTILACVAFLSFLRRRRPAAYALLILATVGWFFSKETIIQLPLLLAAIYFYQRWREQNKLAARTPTSERPPEDKLQREPVLMSRAVWLDLIRLLAAPTAIVIVYLIFYAGFVRNVYTFAPLGYDRAPLTDWPSNVLHWLEFTFNPLLANDTVDNLIGRRPMLYVLNYHIVGPVVLALVLVFALVRRRMLPLFALAMMLVAMIPYFALSYGYYGFRYHYGPMLGGALLAVALGGELWRLAAGKLTGWQSVVRIVVAATGGLWVVAHFLQLVHAVEHDHQANRAPRELYNFFATQTDKTNRPVLFVVDTSPVSDSVDVPLGWGMLECTRLALRTDNVAAVELGYDLEPRVLTAFNRHGEKYLVERTETEWRASRLPDNTRLTFAVAQDGIGRVALERPR